MKSESSLKPVLEIKNISKKFRISHQKEAYLSLRDSLASLFKRDKMISEDFWALQDISFDVHAGDSMGIVGRNGAGKSTLLKILSRITPPTAGKIISRGRIGSLLEVGTGFHPELSGRENIFLNGSILGMRRKEIEKKFDEIIDFSGTEKFLDTPLKHYSSGMQVRLAFAVAAFLEPEVLVIDEVLAVGDAEFQKKCIGKMEEVSQKQGRTVLFVSHNMQVIRKLCQKGVLLSNGKIREFGSIDTVTNAYLNENSTTVDSTNIKTVLENLPKDKTVKINDIKILQNNISAEIILSHLPLYIEVNYTVFEKTKGLRIFFDLCDNDDTILLRSFHDEDHESIPDMEPGDYKSIAIIPGNFLGPITYKIKIHAGIFNVRMCTPSDGIIIPLHVELTGDYNRAYPMDSFRSKLAIKINWQTNHFKTA